MNGTADRALQRLADLDTCAVSDALDACGLDGVVAGIAARWDCGRIAGRAFPIELGDADRDDAPTGVHLGARAITEAAEGDIVVVDNGGRTTSAGWGGLLSRAAARRGLGGVVVYGAARDIDEARSMGFALYASDATPRTARGRTVEVSSGEPITIAGVVVRRGDLLLADGTGVVVVPAARETEVLDKAEQIAAREQAMAARIDDGIAVTAVMDGSYESMLGTRSGS